MPYNASIFNCMYVVLKITFILIAIHTGLLWSVQTSPELSDNINVASEAKVELIHFLHLWLRVIHHIYFSSQSGHFCYW